MPESLLSRFWALTHARREFDATWSRPWTVVDNTHPWLSGSRRAHAQSHGAALHEHKYQTPTSRQGLHNALTKPILLGARETHAGQTEARSTLSLCLAKAQA